MVIHDLLHRLLDGIDCRLELLVVLERHMFFHLKSMCLEHTVFLHEIRSLYAVKSLKDSHLCIFSHFGHWNDLQHTGNHAHGVQVVLGRFFGIVVFLRQQNKRPFIFVGCFK